MEAAVIAIPHPKWTERPLLIVVAAPSSNLTKEDMLNFLKVCCPAPAPSPPPHPHRDKGMCCAQLGVQITFSSHLYICIDPTTRQIDRYWVCPMQLRGA